MNCAVTTLNGVQSLRFGGKRIGTIELTETINRIDSITIHFDVGSQLVLPSAADVSEQLYCPRVFVMEGTPSDMFLIFGGQFIYWITHDGQIRHKDSLFRTWGEEEYWTMEVIEHGSLTIVIYEAGVLAIEETLRVRWHSPKMFNDHFLALEGNMLKFLREEEVEWLMHLEDGATVG